MLFKTGQTKRHSTVYIILQLPFPHGIELPHGRWEKRSSYTFSVPAWIYYAASSAYRNLLAEGVINIGHNNFKFIY